MIPGTTVLVPGSMLSQTVWNRTFFWIVRTSKRAPHSTAFRSHYFSQERTCCSRGFVESDRISWHNHRRSELMNKLSHEKESLRPPNALHRCCSILISCDNDLRISGITWHGVPIYMRRWYGGTSCFCCSFGIQRYDPTESKS
jgi:hypothetical protein